MLFFQSISRPLRTFLPAVFCLAVTSSLVGCVVPLKYPPVVFDPSAPEPEIDFENLAVFAKLSADAYASDRAVRRAYGKDNVIIRPLPRFDGRYILILDHADRMQTISIRGTASKQNAISDLDSLKVHNTKLDVFVHKGFLDATEELIADVTPFLQKDYTTRVTGHSLGGAVACLLMMHLLEEGVTVDQVVTFGQPKVTNEGGGQVYSEAPILRVINHMDIIVHLPPSNLVFDLSGPYKHFGPELLLTPEPTARYAPVHHPRDIITDGNWKSIRIDEAADHRILDYIKRIKKLAAQTAPSR